MSPLQRFLILRRHGNGQIDVIGTNSGQAFVEKAANKHANRLRIMVGGSFQVQEIQSLGEYIAEHGIPENKVECAIAELDTASA